MTDRTKFYLFGLKGTDKRRLAYGLNPADALSVLRSRLNRTEMRRIKADDYQELHHQRDIPALARQEVLA